MSARTFCTSTILFNTRVDGSVYRRMFLYALCVLFLVCVHTPMSFLRRKPKAEETISGSHRVRIQMMLHSFPTASFELPCDLYSTPIRSILNAASTNLQSQARASGVLLEGDLAAHYEPWNFGAKDSIVTR